MNLVVDTSVIIAVLISEPEHDKIIKQTRNVDLRSAMEIAAEHKLYAYDAYVIACARENRCGLISIDRSLLQAAKEARVSVVEV